MGTLTTVFWYNTCTQFSRNSQMDVEQYRNLKVLHDSTTYPSTRVYYHNVVATRHIDTVDNRSADVDVYGRLRKPGDSQGLLVVVAFFSSA